MLDIEEDLNTEQLDQVTFSLASEISPSDEHHSFTSQSISPSANEIILRALQQPRLDQFAKIFSFLACADRISSDSAVDCFRALDEISHTLFRIAQASPSIFSDLSTSCYGIPEFNVNNTLGLSLWYWQSHRHGYRTLERKIHKKQLKNRGQQNTQPNSTKFTDPFSHIQINVKPEISTSAPGSSGSIHKSAPQDNILQELMGIGNVGPPYYFQRYMMRWTIRPTGDTAVQHLEHLDPPPPSGSLEGPGNNDSQYFGGKQNRAGTNHNSKYGVRYSNEWLPEMLQINEDTGLVEAWGPEPEFRPATGEFALLLDPPIYLPRHVAIQLDAVVDTSADSYINAAFVSSRRRVYGPKKSRKESIIKREGSTTTQGGNNSTVEGHQGSITGKAEESHFPHHEKGEGEKSSTLFGDGHSHGQEDEEDEDALDLDVSFSSLVPYPFVKVVEIPISHPRDLPRIVLLLRKSIMIDTLCRSLNLHETFNSQEAGNGPRGSSSNGKTGNVSGQTDQDDEEDDEALDSDLLLIDTILEAATTMNAKRLKILNNIRSSLSASSSAIDDDEGGSNDNTSDDVSNIMEKSDLFERELAINVSLVEENDEVHLTVSIPFLSHFSFWVTPTLKPPGNIGYSLSHINFSSTLPNGATISGSSDDLDLVGLATKLSAALEMTEDLGLVCRFLSHRLCKK